MRVGGGGGIWDSWMVMVSLLVLVRELGTGRSLNNFPVPVRKAGRQRKGNIIKSYTKVLHKHQTLTKCRRILKYSFMS